ncbi:pentapeptide repeat-containing protein [Streptomyces sp. S1A]|uniref:pentapeptide repeat-containing protein n=1 Tax=Streptomyces sp. ICN903 TaxID=2964654 RepID=UPI001EDAE100|nr:pentapeptide repeat-containing protein [Streptomyces sp. ICN903]MCG3039797.1 pentapeptide repeat-containing protein [Streptomyces sp. ICN903]
MTPSRSGPSPALIFWPHCGRGADAADPAGCPGILLPGHSTCLAHLDEADRTAHLATLSPGDDIDLRGTSFTQDLLNELLRALTDPATGRPRFGTLLLEGADFDDGLRIDDAEFGGDLQLEGAHIGGDLSFGGLRVGGEISFHEARIDGDVLLGGTETGGDLSFQQARIGGNSLLTKVRTGGDLLFVRTEIGGYVMVGETTADGGAQFYDARIGGPVQFLHARIGGSAGFAWARVDGHLSFHDTRVGGRAWFTGAVIGGDARFAGMLFERTTKLGPLVCAGTLDLSEAVFGTAVTVEAAAKAVRCRRTRWTSTAALRLRYAEVDLSDAVLEYPVGVAAHSRPFASHRSRIPEHGLTDPRVRIVSLRGVDAAHLMLTGTDLTGCLFAGTVHLDQLRLEGHCRMAAAPAGLRRRGLRPVRWTPRRTLAEEHHWRAAHGGHGSGWAPAPRGEDAQEPAVLAPVYRQLRKALEEGKDEPGAADFYYGEMEMRRHDASRPRGERALLAAYWAVSGYGLRAVRALGWLGATMLVTVVLLMGFGIPEDSPKQEATGTVPPGGGTVTLTIGKADPRNPTGDRFTGERFEKALNVTLNSVVFRSSGQDLTTTGTYTEMASRLVEPVLLGLAVLAVRNRVKR